MDTETKRQAVSSDRAVKAFNSRGLNGQENVLGNIKSNAEMLWDEIDGIPVAPGNTEAGRYIALAKTELESAVMWATKAISRT